MPNQFSPTKQNKADPKRRPLTVTREALLRDNSDDEFRILVHNLLAFSTRLEAVRQNFGTLLGLSGIQYTLLISISHLQGTRGVGVKALAGHLSLSSAFVTIETGKLVKLGFIGKRINPDDRRRVQLVLTRRGRAHLAKLASVQQEVNDVLFASLSAADFDKLNKIAAGLVEGAEKATQLSEYLTGTKRSAE